MVLSFILIQNRQGKTRLAKWYSPYNDDDKIKLKGEIHRLVAPRDQKHQSNFVEFRGSSKIVYRRYAGLFFCACVDANDNELAYLEAIHFFVEVLDQFFGNVCELDLVFNFYKASDQRSMHELPVYAILDEVFLAGEIQETSKQVVLTRLEHLDKLELAVAQDKSVKQSVSAIFGLDPQLDGCSDSSGSEQKAFNDDTTLVDGRTICQVKCEAQAFVNMLGSDSNRGTTARSVDVYIKHATGTYPTRAAALYFKERWAGIAPGFYNTYQEIVEHRERGGSPETPFSEICARTEVSVMLGVSGAQKRQATKAKAALVKRHEAEEKAEKLRGSLDRLGARITEELEASDHTTYHAPLGMGPSDNASERSDDQKFARDVVD